MRERPRPTNTTAKAVTQSLRVNSNFVRIADIYVFRFEGPLCSLSFESERYRPQAYHGDDIAF
jgi:hypothetical protein